MSALVATFLGSAKSRLLPPSIPFRFFAAAVLFHVAMWIALLLDPAGAAGFHMGLGPPLAALHLLALGVLTTTAIGASLQLLPVATRRALTAFWPIKVVFWLTVPGIAVLAAGMALGETGALVVGAVLVAAGLLLFAIIFADNLRRATGLPVLVAYGWSAWAGLLLLFSFGLALALDYRISLLPDHAAVALAHMLLGGFGFMGLLVLGFSHILVPMFALAVAPEKMPSLLVLALALAGLLLGTAGALLGSRAALTAAALLGLGAAGGHLWLMRRVLAGGMRKRLGLSFVFVRAAWVLLPLTLLVGLAALYGYAGANGPTLFGFLLLGGWLLTFLLGILQRIVPFLASMHPLRPGAGPHRLLSELAISWPLKLHAACHALALSGLAAAIVLDHALLLRVAAAIGLVGALSFAWFTADVLRRLSWAAPESAG
jgi:hypothetical protein